MARSSEAQAARRRQRDLGHDADDEREAFGAQALLHGPERVYGAPRLHDQAGLRGKPQGGKAAPIGKPELVGENGGTAPHDVSGAGGGIARLQAAHREPGCKAEGRGPVAESIARRLRLRLDLVQGAGFQAPGKVAVELWHTEGPALSSGGLAQAGGIGGAIVGRGVAALERSDAGAQAGQQGVLSSAWRSSRGPIRNGDEGVAVPVWARRPKP